MALWIVLFLLIIAISFFLALQSMRDFTEFPTKDEDFNLYLVRRTSNLTQGILESIQAELLDSKQLISFERLIKGDKSALCVYGPKRILQNYIVSLDLLELVDYTNVDSKNISSWEVSVRDKGNIDMRDFFKNLHSLSKDEQIWWQLILFPQKEKTFNSQIRVVVTSEDPLKIKDLAQTVQNLSSEKFLKLPKAYSDEQMLDFYQKRSFIKNPSIVSLNSSEVYELILI